MKVRPLFISAGIGAIALVTVLTACGHQRHHQNMEKHADRIVHKITDELDLDAAQIEKLDTLKNEILEIGREMETRRASSTAEVERLLTQPTLDRQKLIDMVDERTRLANEKAPIIIAALGNFYDSLTLEQQRRLHDELAAYQERHRRWWAH